MLQEEAPVILNPSAGQRGFRQTNRHDTETVIEASRTVGIPYRLLSPSYPDEITPRVGAEIRCGARFVVPARGGGTVRRVAASIRGTPTPLGMLPRGSNMTITRSLGIPRVIVEAATILRDEHSQWTDIGEVNGTSFYEDVPRGQRSIIFALFAAMQDGKVFHLRRFTWWLGHTRPIRVTLWLDHLSPLGIYAAAISIAHGLYVSARLTVTPNARLGNGKLHSVIFAHFSTLTRLRHFDYFGRKHRHPQMRILQGQIRADARPHCQCMLMELTSSVPQWRFEVSNRHYVSLFRETRRRLDSEKKRGAPVYDRHATNISRWYSWAR